MIKNLFFITWKGLYPYEYMDSCDKFQGIHLPPKKAYLSKLNMKRFFGDTYLKTDVLLLEDLFQTFEIRA